MSINQVNIAEKLMAVRLNCSYSFGRATDKQITRETNAVKQTHSLLVRKELLPGPSGVYLKELQSTLSAFYAYHKKVTMAAADDGERLLPVAFCLDYDNEFMVYAKLVEEKFSTFEAQYPASVAMAPGLLNKAFDIRDYPKQSELRKHLKFSVRRLPLPDANTLLDVVGESIQSDVDGFMADAMKLAFADVNKRIRDRLTNMSEVLNNPKGRVHDSLVEGLKELVSFVPEFNVTADDSLTLLCEEIKTKLLCHGVEDLKDRDVRIGVAAQAQEILRRMG